MSTCECKWRSCRSGSSESFPPGRRPVAKGYWKDPGKTKQVFIPNPYGRGFVNQEYATLYRTGDIGYFREDGNVECLGRIDNQVKIRGFRIETGEIENLLLKKPGIKERKNIPNICLKIGILYNTDTFVKMTIAQNIKGIELDLVISNFKLIFSNI